MRTGVSGLLISNLARYLLHLPKPSVFRPLSADYSTKPNGREMGEGRIDDWSEEFLFQNFNFGAKSEPEKEVTNDRNPASPIPGRALRGERTVDGGQEDLFPDFKNKQRGMGRNHSNTPSMRAEKSDGARPFQQKSGEGFSFLGQKGPSCSALQPNREEERSSGSLKKNDQKKEGDRIVGFLVEKLKLRDVSVDGGNQTSTNRSAFQPNLEGERSSGSLKKNDQEKGEDRIVGSLFEKLKLRDLSMDGRNQTSTNRSALQPNLEERSSGSLKKNDQEKGVNGIGESLFEKLKLRDPSTSGGNQTSPKRSAPEPNGGEEGNDGSLKKSDQEKGGNRIGESLFEKLKLAELGNEGRNQRLTTAAADSTEPESPLEDADEIFKQMKETGLIPNAVAMLDELCKDGLVKEAMKLFGLMREKGTIPEVVIYTAVIQGFCKAAKFDDAKRIFRKMEKNGIVPNAFSYWVLIQGLCKGKKLEDAVEFSMEMVASGHSPNAATLTSLVDVYSKDKGLKEAEELVRKLRERGFAPDEKALREYLNKKGPYSPMVWEAIFGKKNSHWPF
ncbi:Pentatricopeptide repeat-containing protein [Apostasia shenzhenica]|uniref:Pentatricopeptide repeat-containing protein n=1 Tax=Apostasia shenzhenica TaxID=1088818 RepID=A0A2I0AXG4_9ASPA|nr:Pentatricopeptide repeat-containing protein [Apostasia shenzhenica]